MFSKTMGQRILSLMLVTIMVVGLFPPIPVQAADNVYGVLKSDSLVYATNEGNTELPGDEIDRNELTHLYVDNGVSSIEQNAFQYCPKLTTVSMPSVTTIGDSAFSNCSKLTSVFQPNVISIGNNSFQGCGSLSSVDLPEVLFIGAYGFSGCEALASVNSPKLTTIGDYAFDNCNNFANLTLGATPPTVDACAFGAAPRTNLTVAENSVSDYESADAFGTQGYWYDWALPYHLTVNNGITSGDYRIGTTVSVTANPAEDGMSFIDWTIDNKGPGFELVDKNKVTTTFVMPGKDAEVTAWYVADPVATFTVTFNENNGVDATTSQVISAGTPQNLTPNAFTRVGYSFTGWNTAVDGQGTSYADGVSFTATANTTLYAQWTASVPATPGYGVLRVDNKVYATNADNTKKDGGIIDRNIVTHLFVANDVTNIRMLSFFSCPTLIEVNMPHVTSIGDQAFYGCTKLTTINAPEVTTLGFWAFAECVNLNNITLGATPPSVMPDVFDKCPRTSLNIAGGNTSDAIALYETADANGSPGFWYGWQLVGQTYALSYNANDGAGSMSPQSFAPATAQPLTTNTFIRAGFAFNNWNTSADGTGTSYADGASFTATANTTLYAQWTENTPSPAAEPGYGVLRSGNKVYTTDVTNTKTDGVEMNIADVTHLYVADGVTAIAPVLFANRLNLIEVNAPSVTSIGESAFSGCVNLATINFPVVTSLGYEAFRDCAGLTTVSLPKVTTVNAYVFMDCSNLTTVDLSEALTLGEKAFSGCKKLSTITVPKVITIGTEVFVNCVGLTTVDLPAVMEVGDYAFFNCGGLKSINLPVATTIGKYAFNKCNDLITVDLPSVTTLSDYAFGFMNGLTSVRLPAITSIGVGAFYNCPVLANLAIVISPPTVGEDAFQGCPKTNISFIGVTTTAEIKSVVSAYDVSYAIANPTDERVGYWYGWALPHTLSVTDGTVNSPSDTGLYPTGTTISVTANTPPEGQRFVNWGTMQDRGIGDDDVVFADAKATTTTFVMPGRYTSVSAGFEAFTQYTVTFNANGGSGRMFAQIFNDVETKNLTHNAFTGVDCLFAGWNTRADGSGTAYADDAFFTASANTTLYAQWVYDYGVLKNDGKIYLSNSDNTKTDGQVINRNSVKHLFVDAGVTIIDEVVFQNCTNLVTVDLSKVASLIIKKDAFHGCTGLTTIDLKNVTSVGESSFEGCELLTTVDLQNATEIGTGSFGNCSGLTTVNIPKLTSIPKGAFYECSNLTTIDLSKVTTINELAFALCAKLKTVDLSAVTTVGFAAFGLCTSLENVELPLITTLPESLFSQCTALKTVSIPKVTELETCAFEECTALTDLTVGATPPTVGVEVFKDCSNKTNLKIDGGNTIKAIGDYNAVDDGDVRENYWYDWQLKIDVYALTVNGGTGGGNFAQGTDVTITAGTAPNGQRFKSWSQNGVTLAKATDATTTFVMPGNAVTVTAEYEAIPIITIDFNANEGVGTMPQQQVSNPSQTINTNVFTRTGYTFTGWNTSADGSGTHYVDGDTFTTSVNIVLYAQWSLLAEPGYGVLRDDNKVYATNLNNTKTDGEEMGNTLVTHLFVSSDVTAIDNSAFYKCINLTTVDLSQATSIAIGPSAFAECINLTTIDLSKVTSIGDHAFFKCSGLTTIDLSKVITIDAFAFCSCTGLTSVDLSEVTTISTGVFSLCSSLESVNMPKATEIKVGAFADCESFANIIVSTTPPHVELPTVLGVDIAFFNCPCTNLSIVGGNTLAAITEYKNISGTSDNSWYGWPLKANAYDLLVTGGTGGGHFAEGTEVTITAGTPPTTGQRFKSWTQNGIVLATDAITTFTMPGNAVTVTAEYEVIPVTSISYDANGGAGTTASQQISEGSPQALTKNAFSRAGYSFKDWNTSAAGTGAAYADGAAFSASNVTATTTLYAQWTENTYKVSATVVNGNGDKLSGAKIELKKGDTTIGAAVTTGADGSFSSVQVPKGGYSLVVSKDGFTVTTPVTVNDADIQLGAIVLYQTLTVNSGTGTGNYGEGATVTITAAAPAAGQRFTTWTVAGEGVTLNNAAAATTTFTMPANAVAVTANYEVIPITSISYDANSGTGTTASQQISEGSPQNLTKNAFSRAGYSFKDWNTSAVGTGTAYADGAAFSASNVTATTTLYAQWTENTPAEPGYGVLGHDGRVYTTNVDNTKTDGVVIDKATVQTTVTHLFAADDVKSIEDSAFCNCEVLTTVTMPKVTAIGEEAFNGCQALTSVEVPAVTLIDEGAFSMDDALVHINMAAVETINAGAFANCEKMETAEMPAATSIGIAAFANCRVLTTVKMPLITSINDQLFINDKALTTVEIPKVTSIGTAAFAGCGALTTVEVPTVTAIGMEAFSQCPLLSNLTVGATPPTVGKDSFKACKPTNLTIVGKTPAAIAAYEAADTSTPNGYWYGWALSYPLTVNKGTVNEATASGDYRIGTTVTIRATAPEDGQRFKEWTIQKGDVVLAKATDAETTFTMPGKTVEVTANYEAIPVTSISFDANSGAGTTASQQISAGSPQNLSVNTFTRVGYSFKNWNTSADGSGTAYADSAQFSASVTESVVLYAQWTDNKNTFTVSGTVADSADQPLSGAVVKLMQGNAQIGVSITTDVDGGFTINNVPNGNYNLVVSKNGVVVTTLVNINNADPGFSSAIILPDEKMNSEVVVKENTPAIVVGNLEQQFTDADKVLAAAGDLVEIKFTAEAEDETAPNVGNITAAAAATGRTVGMFIDFSVFKTIGSAAPDSLPELPSLIEVLIPLDASLQGKTDYTIYRYHGSAVEAITKIPNAQGEKIELIDDGATIKLSAKKFSTYAVAYAEAVPDPGPGPSPVQTYTLTYNENGGTGIMKEQVFAESTKQALIKNTFERTGFGFAGWNTKQDGTGTAYADGADFTAAATTTLYAQWTENEITLPDGVTYRTHIQNNGWETAWTSDGNRSGTEGQSLRLEAIEINLTGENLPAVAHIEYLTHVQNTGWETDWTRDGQPAGTEGQCLRLEAIQIRLVDMPGYSVQYRVHVQNQGWETAWSADGDSAGTEGQSLRLEAIEIRLVKTND
ncbi:leucine-rich repeat protein [Acetobacterium bakii]|nr:leucine-rich repeat protein [Acetobacterium bakii]